MNINVNRTGKTYGPKDIQLLIDRIRCDKFRNVCFSLDSEIVDVLTEFKTILDFNPEECIDQATKHVKTAVYQSEKVQWPAGLLSNVEA